METVYCILYFLLLVSALSVNSSCSSVPTPLSFWGPQPAIYGTIVDDDEIFIPFLGDQLKGGAMAC